MNSSVFRQDICLALAQAFMPPMSDSDATGALADLADDLVAVAVEISIDIATSARVLRNALNGFENSESLLVHYSRLFLVPPIRARLNLGYYLDGSINGPALDAIEYLQARYGICKSENFHDLPDHLTSLLEFQAMLFAMEHADADQAQLAQRILLPGLSCLGQAILDESDIDSPYLHLVQIAEAVLQAAFPMAEAEHDERSQRHRKARRDLEKGIWRKCLTCDTPYAREKEIRIMAKALQSQNLPYQHLSLCPGCRSASQAWIENEQG